MAFSKNAVEYARRVLRAHYSGADTLPEAAGPVVITPGAVRGARFILEMAGEVWW